MLAIRNYEEREKGATHLGRLNTAIGEDLLHDLILVAGAKLVLKLALASSVEDALLAMSMCELLADSFMIHFISICKRSMKLSMQ